MRRSIASRNGGEEEVEIIGAEGTPWFGALQQTPDRRPGEAEVDLSR